MTTAIIAVFIVGYLCIAFESVLKVNKSATALLMCVLCWTLYMFSAGEYVSLFHAKDFALAQLDNIALTRESFATGTLLLDHLGETAEIIFFLMGAMTIVEVIDSNGGFNFVRFRLATTSKRKLLWRVAFMTFILSATLDNLTTSIVMIMVLRKLVREQKDRLYYAALIIISANSGGAFSPIGDITTIMLWMRGNITTVGVIKEVLLPSIVSMVVPALILQHHLKGTLEMKETAPERMPDDISRRERIIIFWIGVGGLIMVPVFREFTGLPPFMGILLVLSLLWIVTEIMSQHSTNKVKNRTVIDLMSRIDLSTILFFLGILMAVSTLAETGVLNSLGKSLEAITNGNAYIITGTIGVASSIVDNVPLVAGCMGMYPMVSAQAAMSNPELLQFVQDGTFWQLLGYCAGVGGSLLIIGSAAGVVVMGLEKITFGWYLKNITWIAFVGYICGILTYALEKAFIF